MRVTLRDIAKRLNLSHATVSFVLNDRQDIAIPTVTRERVMTAAKEMGYRPNRAAQALVRGKTNMVALWLPNADNPLYARIMKEMVARGNARGYEVIVRVVNTSLPATEKLELDDWPVDGILAVDTALLERFDLSQASNLPIVTFGVYFDQKTDYVGIDLPAGINSAFKHLVKNGANRIAFVSQHEAADLYDLRLLAYSEACNQNGLQPEVIDCIDSSKAGVRAHVKETIRSNGVPDALILSTDAIGPAVFRSLEDLGIKVPMECQVVGCDGLEEGEFTCPSLSTVALPISEMCSLAWQVLDIRLGERAKDFTAGRGHYANQTPIEVEAPEQAAPERHLLKSKLIVRNSLLAS